MGFWMTKSNKSGSGRLDVVVQNKTRHGVRNYDETKEQNPLPVPTPTSVRSGYDVEIFRDEIPLVRETLKI